MRGQAAIPLAALVVAVAGALLWDLARTPTYAAQTTLLVSSGLTKSGAALQTELETFRQLARTPIVAQNVVQSLAPGESADALLRRTSVSTDAKASLLRLTVEGSSSTKAVQLCQQYASAFLAIAQARVGASARLTVWEPARPLGRVSPRPARDASIAGAGGLLVGLLLLGVRRRRSAPSDTRVDESLRADTGVTEALGPHVDAVVRRAIELGERERELEARERALEHAAPRPAALAGAPPEPERAPEPEPPPAQPASRWTVGELERRVDAARSRFPERLEEWEVYLDQFRALGDENGAIPAQFEGLVWEVFEPLL